jgi:fatty-acyl-CoA synthase
MLGLMQRRPLGVPIIFHRMEEVFPQSQIISVRDGQARVVSYADWAADVRRIAGAFRDLGLKPGSRVATLCPNTVEHLSLFYAVPCAGLVLHAVNHRLSAEHIAFIIRDSGARVLVVDRDMVGSLPERESVPQLELIIAVGGGMSLKGPRVISFTSMLEAAPHEGDFVVADEDCAASICYTSGTTGLPKGVAYSHRSIMLHALMSLAADAIGLSEFNAVMPIVPMFHANAWGLPFSAAFAGADLVLPGHGSKPRELVDLLETHRVTCAAAVATVWRDMLPHTAGHDLSHLERALTGGGPLPPSLSRAWYDSAGIMLRNGWGMTELGPLGTVSRLRREHSGLTPQQQLDVFASPGPPAPLVRLRIGDETPEPGSSGELQVSGPTVASAYYGRAGADGFSADGWLRTGDIAMLDHSGNLQVTDRLKDVIKSGGEWISSVSLENMIMEHPDVAEAAVIGVPHERWDERPIAIAVPRTGAQLSERLLLDHLRPRVAKWWLPDRILISTALPRTATGKIAKLALREEYAKLQEKPSSSGAAGSVE